jgi:hypothetical protein
VIVKFPVSAARPVVIAAHNNSTELPGQFNNFIGVRAVAYDIAEIPDHIMFRRGGKNRFESREIGVNVRNHECTHLSSCVAFWLYSHLVERVGILLFWRRASTSSPELMQERRGDSTTPTYHCEHHRTIRSYPTGSAVAYVLCTLCSLPPQPSCEPSPGS